MKLRKKLAIYYWIRPLKYLRANPASSSEMETRTIIPALVLYNTEKDPYCSAGLLSVHETEYNTSRLPNDGKIYMSIIFSRPAYSNFKPPPSGFDPGTECVMTHNQNGDMVRGYRWLDSENNIFTSWYDWIPADQLISNLGPEGSDYVGLVPGFVEERFVIAPPSMEVVRDVDVMTLLIEGFGEISVGCASPSMEDVKDEIVETLLMEDFGKISLDCEGDFEMGE